MAVFDNLNYTYSAGVSTAVLQQYYLRKVLENVQPEMVHARDAQIVPMPLHSGKYATFRKYTPLAVSLNPLAEGGVNAGQTIVHSAFSVMVKPFAQHIEITDEMNMYMLDDMQKVSAQLLADQAADTMDQLCRNAMNAGLNVQYVDGANNTTRGTLAATDKLTYAEVKLAVRTLKRNKCKPFPDGFYHAIVHPDVVHDLTSDAMFTDVSKYQDKAKVEKYELGTIWKVKFFESTNAKTFAPQTYIYGVTESIVASANYDATNKCITTAATISSDDGRAMTGLLVNVAYTKSATKYVTPMCIERVDATNKKIYFRWNPAAAVYAEWTTAQTLTIEPTGGGAADITVYSTLVYGQDAFGRVALNGNDGNVDLIIKGTDSGGGENPYNNRGTIAWKVKSFCCAVIQDDFLVRIEGGATA